MWVMLGQLGNALPVSQALPLADAMDDLTSALSAGRMTW